MKKILSGGLGLLIAMLAPGTRAYSSAALEFSADAAPTRAAGLPLQMNLFPVNLSLAPGNSSAQIGSLDVFSAPPLESEDIKVKSAESSGLNPSSFNKKNPFAFDWNADAIETPGTRISGKSSRLSRRLAARISGLTLPLTRAILVKRAGIAATLSTIFDRAEGAPGVLESSARPGNRTASPRMDAGASLSAAKPLAQKIRVAAEAEIEIPGEASSPGISASDKQPPISRIRRSIRPLFFSALLIVGPLSGAANAGMAPPHQMDASDMARAAAFAVPLAAIGAWGLVKISAHLLKKKGISFLSPLENFRPLPPLHKPLSPRFRHYLLNLSFGAIAIAAITLFIGPHINSLYRFANAHGIGLLHWLKIGGLANAILAIPLLDFMEYWWHRLLHQRLTLWRLHKVHHSDPDIDFSSTYRTHPVEMIMETALRLGQYLIVGPTLWTILVYELLMTALGGFHHANVKIPEPWESRLSRVLITSKRHYLHHSADPMDFNSNYGGLFSFWDRLMGTWRDYDSAAHPDGIAAGLRQYPDPRNLTFIDLLMMPFRSRKPPASAKKNQ